MHIKNRFAITPKKKRALVVEDDIWMKPLITLALKSAMPGVLIDWVDSVEEALKKAEKRQYDLMISDIYLNPGRETGLGFWYRCQEKFPETPILLTSSIPIDSFARSMEEDGMAPHYLAKPFNVNQFKTVIEELTSSAGLSS